MIDKGLHKAKYETNAACRQGKVEQVYINSKCGYSTLSDQLYFRCWFLSVQFISLWDRRNPSMHYRNLSVQYIKKTH